MLYDDGRITKLAMPVLNMATHEDFQLPTTTWTPIDSNNDDDNDGIDNDDNDDNDDDDNNNANSVNDDNAE